MITETNISRSYQGSYIEWGTIIAGTVLAIAISQVLIQFGIAVGVADLNDMRTNLPTRAELIGGGVYILVIQLLSSTLGGYIAGRMRAPIAGNPVHEREIRDGIHGLMVWALGTVAMGIALFAATAFHMQADTATAETAKDVLAQRHTVAVILAFSAGATSLVSAVCAWAAAAKGGEHRDDMTDHSRHVSFRKKH